MEVKPEKAAKKGIPSIALWFASIFMTGLGVKDLLFRPHMHDVGIGILLGTGGTLLMTIAVDYCLHL